jgi:hypothetical protein
MSIEMELIDKIIGKKCDMCHKKVTHPSDFVDEFYRYILDLNKSNRVLCPICIRPFMRDKWDWRLNKEIKEKP